MGGGGGGGGGSLDKRPVKTAQWSNYLPWCHVNNWFGIHRTYVFHAISDLFYVDSDNLESAVLGDLKLSMTSPYHLEAEVTGVSHPLYDGEAIVNDIALVTFANPLEFTNDYVRPICLAEHDNTTLYKACYITGWGHTSEGNIIIDK